MLSTELVDDGTLNVNSLFSEGLGGLDDSGGLPSFLGVETPDAEKVGEGEGGGDGHGDGTATDADLSRVCNMLMSLFASRSCNSTPRTTAAPASGAGRGVTPSDLLPRRRTEGVIVDGSGFPLRQKGQMNRGEREGNDAWRSLPQLKTRSSQHRASSLTALTQPAVHDNNHRPSAGVLEKLDVASLLDTVLSGGTMHQDEAKWKRLGEGLETLLSGMQDHQNEESINYLMRWLQQVTEEQESASVQASDVAQSGDTDFRASFLQQLELMGGTSALEVASGSSYCDPAELVGSFGELSEGPSALTDSGTELHASSSSDGLGRLDCVSGAASKAEQGCNSECSERRGGGEWMLPGRDMKVSLANVPARSIGIGRRYGAEQGVMADSGGTEAAKSCSEPEDGREDEDDEAPVGLRAYSSTWSNVHSVNWLATRRTSEDSFLGNRSSGRNSSERVSTVRRPISRTASGRRSTTDLREEERAGSGRKGSSSVGLPGEKTFGEHGVISPPSVQASKADVQRSSESLETLAARELQTENGPLQPMPRPRLLSQDRSMSLSSFLTDLSSSDGGLPEFALSPLQASPATSACGSQPQSGNCSPRPPCSDDDLPLPSLLRESPKRGILQHCPTYETGDVAVPGSTAQLPILPPPPSTLVPQSLAAPLTSTPHPWSTSDLSANPMPSSSSMVFSPPVPSSSLVAHQPDEPHTLTSTHTLTSPHTLTLPQSLLSFSNPSASSDSEMDPDLRRSTKARESLESFSDPDVPIPKLKRTSNSSQAEESTSRPPYKEETSTGGRKAATTPMADAGSSMATGTMGYVAGAMGAGSSDYANSAGVSSKRASETAGVGLLTGGGISWDEVGEMDDVHGGISGMEFGGNSAAVSGEGEGLERRDGKGEDDGGQTDYMGSDIVGERAANSGSVQSCGAVAAEATGFELISARGRKESVAEEATPRLSAVLQVLQSARQKIRAVTVPSRLQPSATYAAALDFQETATSASLPMPRQSPLGISSSHKDLPPAHLPSGSHNPLAAEQPLVVRKEQTIRAGESSQPSLQSSSSHTASKLRQPVTTARSCDSHVKRGSGSGSMQERAELQAAGDSGLAASTKAVTSVSTLREVVRARREKQAGASSGRKPSTGDSKKPARSSAAAGAASGAAAGAAASLDGVYYEEGGCQSGSGSDRSRSSRARRAGGGVSARPSRSKDKQAGKGKERSDLVALNPDLSTADEADGSILPLRRSKPSSSHQHSSPLSPTRPVVGSSSK
ncbi:hypothetical protein CLOM_g18170 [Closterium sp. NIES-68]|nr:hypothetical protein CLOM_g18170 [Closterium sp. NIES-68]